MREQSLKQKQMNISSHIQYTHNKFAKTQINQTQGVGRSDQITWLENVTNKSVRPGMRHPSLRSSQSHPAGPVTTD